MREDDTDLRVMDTQTVDNLGTIEVRTDAPLAELASPFLNWSPQEVYEWWQRHIQAPHHSKAGHWAYFNFIILDADTLPQHEDDQPQLLLCCDAPDVGEAENEIRLKTIRTHFEDALEHILTFEMLSMCPSEKGKGWAVSVNPHPTLLSTDEPGVFTVASPERARQNKRNALLQLEEAQRQEAAAAALVTMD